MRLTREKLLCKQLSVYVYPPPVQGAAPEYRQHAIWTKADMIKSVHIFQRPYVSWTLSATFSTMTAQYASGAPKHVPL